MVYYNDNPAIFNADSLTDMKVDNSKLAEEDAIALVDKSLVKLEVPCGGGPCAPCLNNGSCQAGLTCSLFR